MKPIIRRSGLFLSLFLASTGGCQLISGLSGLGVQEGQADGSGGLGGSMVASSSSSSSSGGLASGDGGVGGSGGSGGGEPSCDLPPCVTTLLDVPGADVELLAVTSSFVVWSNRSLNLASEIWSASPAGESPSAAFTTGVVKGLVADNQNAYWINEGPPGITIERGSLDGSVSSGTLPAGTLNQATALSLFNNSIFWVDVDANELWRMSTPGDVPQLLADTIVGANLSAVRSLAFDAIHVYWNDIGGAAPSLKSVLYSPQMASLPVALAPTSADVFGLANVAVGSANNSPYIYYTENVGSGAGGVRRVAVSADAALSELVAPKLTFPTQLVGDSANIYWIDGDDGSCSSKAALRMRSTNPSSTAIRTLLSDLPCPSNLVLYKSTVYVGAGSKIYAIK